MTMPTWMVNYFTFKKTGQIRRIFGIGIKKIYLSDSIGPVFENHKKSCITPPYCTAVLLAVVLMVLTGAISHDAAGPRTM